MIEPQIEHELNVNWTQIRQWNPNWTCIEQTIEHRLSDLTYIEHELNTDCTPILRLNPDWTWIAHGLNTNSSIEPELNTNWTYYLIWTRLNTDWTQIMHQFSDWTIRGYNRWGALLFWHHLCCFFVHLPVYIFLEGSELPFIYNSVFVCNSWWTKQVPSMYQAPVSSCLLNYLLSCLLNCFFNCLLKCPINCKLTYSRCKM